MKENILKFLEKNKDLKKTISYFKNLYFRLDCKMHYRR